MATKKKPAAAAKKKKKAALVAKRKLTTKDAIKAAVKVLTGCLVSGNAAAIAACYTKKAVLMPAGAPTVKGAKAIGSFWASAVAGMGIKSAKLKVVEVDELGTTAIECGAYKLKGAGGALLGTGKYVVVWKREDRAWKLHRDIFNADS